MRGPGRCNKASGAESVKITASVKEIIQHGLFSTNIFSVVILIGVIIGTAVMLSELLEDGLTGNIVSVFTSMFMAVWLVAGLALSILKGYIKYMDFEIQRQGDKVLLNYGILKRVTYSIPVDKINAIKCSQGMFARIAGRYMVEIINVGMGDDDNEKQSFFLPYDKKDNIAKKLGILLPEFEGCMEIQEEHQPACVWKIWLFPMAVYLFITGLLLGAVWEFAPELTLWPAIAVSILSLGLLVERIAAYKTEGCNLDGHFLKIVLGSFGRQCLFVKYDKVQYVTMKQNFLAKHFGVQKGAVHLLAPIQEREHSLPYFPADKQEQLKRYIL